MDAEAARMMADLGSSRRDRMSALQEDKDPDLHEETAIRERAEAQRNLGRQVDASDERSAILSKWNTQATFGTDTIAESLENLFSGQGHRAALEQRLRGYREYGPERSEQRDHFRRDVSPARNIHARGRPGRQYTNAQTSSGSTRQRAASPRSFGTVRFTRDGTRTQQQRPARREETGPSSSKDYGGAVTQTQAAENMSIPLAPSHSGSPLPSRPQPVIPEPQQQLAAVDTSSPPVSPVPSPNSSPRRDSVRPDTPPSPMVDENPVQTSCMTSRRSAVPPNPTAEESNDCNDNPSFWGWAKECIATQVTRIKVSVTATATISSGMPGYDILALANDMEDEANMMHACSYGLAVFKQSADGVWKETGPWCVRK